VANNESPLLATGSWQLARSKEADWLTGRWQLAKKRKRTRRNSFETME
jgi:hypothetical protein